MGELLDYLDAAIADCQQDKLQDAFSRVDSITEIYKFLVDPNINISAAIREMHTFLDKLSAASASAAQWAQNGKFRVPTLWHACPGCKDGVLLFAYMLEASGTRPRAVNFRVIDLINRLTVGDTDVGVCPGFQIDKPDTIRFGRDRYLATCRAGIKDSETTLYTVRELSELVSKLEAIKYSSDVNGTEKVAQINALLGRIELPPYELVRYVRNSMQGHIKDVFRQMASDAIAALKKYN